MTRLILASHSPRRRELLTQIGVPFVSAGVDIDESVIDGESPQQYVRRLAIAKARACALEADPDSVILGSDTTVVCDQQILGKPLDRAQATSMLMKLSGRSHQVMTAVALIRGERCLSEVVTTEVFFRTLSEAECQSYWNSGEPADKAGGYGIQGLGAVFVERIEGSYSAVVGLPLKETAGLLTRMGIPIWQSNTQA